MSRETEIRNILEINNKLISIKSNNPNDYFTIKSTRFRLSKRINNLLNNKKPNQISGPSIPSI